MNSKQKGGQFERDVWRPVVGVPGYEVNDQGYIRGLARYADGRIKKRRTILKPNKAGSIVLRKDGQSISFKVAQIVLRAFLGPPPKGKYLARHLDDDHTNHVLTNLAWGDHQDNYDDGVSNGRHGCGTPGAIIRGDKLRGRSRPISVRKKISRTKRRFPDKQYYGDKHGPNGKFVS